MESAAARPGVLVMPPVMVPSRSRMFILNTNSPTMTATSMGTSVMAAPTPNKSQPLSWNVATRFRPAEVPTSARKSSSPSWRSSWLAGPDIDHRMGPVFPMALRKRATMRMPPVSPGENDRLSEKEMFSLPKSTPSTIPRAMGKKSVSDSCLLSLPSRRATPLIPSFSPTTISLSPNFSARSGEGERSIPLRRTRVTVQPKFFIRLRSPSCLFIMSFLVSSRDSISCMSTSGSSPSSRWPTRTASWFKASSLPTACM